MKGKYITTIIISIIFIIFIVIYFSLILFGLVQSGLGGVITYFVLAIAFGILGLMIYTMIERLKEQKEENPDDYRKY
jgi:predicted tellurium resistance membrane protein TerC